VPDFAGARADNESLGNPFPAEFDALTIGTPINVDLNEFKLYTEAFDIDALCQKKLLKSGTGTAKTEVQAGGTTKQSQDTSGWNASASMGLKTGIVDASAMFYVKQSLNACSRSTKTTIVGTNRVENWVQLKKGTRQQYYDSATPLLKEKIDAVSTAADLPALVVALTDFYRVFGTGFVDRLELLAIGVFEATLSSDSESTKNEFNIGGGVSFSLPAIGAKAAAEYCKTHMDADASATLHVTSYGHPIGSKPKEWAEAAAKTLQEQGIAGCIKPEVWEQAAPKEVAEPDKPVLEYSPKEIPSIPLPSLPKIVGSAIKAMQYSMLPPKLRESYPSPDDAFLAESETLTKQAALTEEQINEQAAQPLSAVPPASRAFAPRAEEVAAEDTGGNPLFGGYAPSGYHYTPWEEVFPELNLRKACTTSQIAFGQSLVWFSIRSVFAQYLDFCANYPGVVLDRAGNKIFVKNDAREFRRALNAVSEFLTESLMDESAKPDLTFLQQLEGRLKEELDNNDFGMFEHYRYWIDNYEWLKRIPFGVVAVVERGGQYFYQENPYPNCPLRGESRTKGYTQATSLAAADLISANAYRLYPIISTDAHGKPYFAWVGAPSHLTGEHPDAVLRFSGLLSFSRVPMEHRSYRVDEARNGFDPRRIPLSEGFAETTIPILVHQSGPAAGEFRAAENTTGWWSDHPRSDADCLQERWDNRKAMFGMHLYPGVGGDDGFGSAAQLLETAGKLARDASRHATVLPAKDEATGQYGKIWRLREPAGAWAAYSAGHAAMFFWGPADGPGWDLFEQCPIRLIPVDYIAVENAVSDNFQGDIETVEPSDRPLWMQSGGRPMWMEPRTKELLDQLHDLVK
jgi:hypothetical protein